MNVIWTTMRRELMGYLFSPVGYVIAFLLYLVRGFEVGGLIRRFSIFGADVEQLSVAYASLATNWIMIVLVPPILTMRCFAEESRTGSLEVLLTAPVKFWEVVVGKWAAAFVFFALLWLPSLLIFWLLSGDGYLAAELPFSTLLSSSVGFALIVGLVLAAGVFASSLTDNVLLAVLVSILFAAALVLGEYFLFPIFAPILDDNAWLGSLLSQLKVFDQVKNWFSRGLIDTAQCVFYLGGIAFFLYMTMRALEVPRRAAAGIGKWFGFLNLGVSAALALAIWLGLSVLGTRSTFRALIDVSPQASFTFGEDTQELLDEIRKRELTVEIDSFYSGLPSRSPDPDVNYRIGLARRVQELTTDLLRLYDRYGGDEVALTQHDPLRGDLKAARERRELLQLSQQQQNTVVVRIGKRRKVLSLNEDLAEIEAPAIQRNPTPGAERKQARLTGYRGEEAISSAIRSLLVEGTPKIYVLDGYGTVTIEQAVANSYSELASALAAQGYQVGKWNLREKGFIPDDADVIALIEPTRELSKRDTETIYAYLKQGGRVFLNVSFLMQPADRNPTFDLLGEKLGFEIGRDLCAHLVPDPRDPNSPGRGGPEASNVKAVLSPHAAATKALARSGMYPAFKSVREIRVRDELPDGVRVDATLAQTGPFAFIARRGRGGLVNLMQTPTVRDAYAVRPLGMMIDVDTDDGVDKRQGHLALFSGIAFINDAGGFQFNGDLALNTFNWMAERRELVSVRGKELRRKQLQITGPQILRSEQLLVWWVPGALVILAFVMFKLRRRE